LALTFSIVRTASRLPCCSRSSACRTVALLKPWQPKRAAGIAPLLLPATITRPSRKASIRAKASWSTPVDVSLSWKLTEREKAILEGGFGRADATPREELARVRDYLTGADSYAFHKWRIEHRNDPGFQEQLKERYDRELAALGVADTDRLTAAESQSLYENLLKNLKRLALLVDWWEVGRRER
jgi:hypothetical protein